MCDLQQSLAWEGSHAQEEPSLSDVLSAGRAPADGLPECLGRATTRAPHRARRPREWPQPLRRVAQLRPWSGFRRPVGNTFPGGGGAAAFFPRARRAARLGSSCSSGSGVDRAGSSAPFGSVLCAMSGTSSGLVGYADVPCSWTGSAAPYTVDACAGPGVDRRRSVRRAAGAGGPAPTRSAWAGRTSSSEDHVSRLAARSPARPPTSRRRARREAIREPGPGGRRPAASGPATALCGGAARGLPDTSYGSGDHRMMITKPSR